MRRALVILIILAVVVGGSWLGYQRFGPARAAAAPDYEVVNVKRGNIISTVSATGSVQPLKDTNLTLSGTGTVTRVAVAVGDHVAAGQVLAELDTTDLEMALRQAQVSLRTAQAQLQQLKDGPSAADLAAAQAALKSAQTNYDQLLAGADADQQAAARAQVEQAKVTLDQAQQAYDRVKDNPNIGMLPQSLQLQQATINYQTAQAQFRVTTRGATQAQVAAAQAQVVQAQATLDKLQRGASASQIEVAQAGVDQAQLGIEQAQRRLDLARLKAPWDGVVTAVNVTEGGPAQTGAPAIQMADISHYHIDVLVDEADIASIATGQPVTIDIDALPNRTLAGHVAKIAPAAIPATTGVVSYQVTVDIDPSDAPLRGGMSATTNITSSSRQNVLLLPNRAIQIERETGKAFVERLNNGTPQKTEVRLGLRDDQQSEIREGLGDGDQVIIRNLTGIERLQQTFGTAN